MIQLVGHIEALIDNIGFWDVGCHNLPEVSIDGKYVCAVDFENVDLEQKKERAEGLKRLVYLFPCSTISDNIIEHSLDFIIDSNFRCQQEMYDMEVGMWGDQGYLKPPSRGKNHCRLGPAYHQTTGVNLPPRCNHVL